MAAIKKIKLSRKLAYTIGLGVLVDTICKLLYALGWANTSQRKPDLLGVVIGGFGGVAIFYAAKVFEEISAKNIFRALGSASVLYACSYGAEYFRAEMLRYPFLILSIAVETVALYACYVNISRLRAE